MRSCRKFAKKFTSRWWCRACCNAFFVFSRVVRLTRNAQSFYFSCASRIRKKIWNMW